MEEESLALQRREAVSNKAQVHETVRPHKGSAKWQAGVPEWLAQEPGQRLGLNDCAGVNSGTR